MVVRRIIPVICLAAFIGPAPAAVFFVSKSAPGPAHDGSTWARAFATVQAGVNAAAPTGAQVWTAAGIYPENVALKKGVALYGGFAGTETALAQRNPAANPTVLDGQQAGPVVKVDTTATTATRLDGFVIRNGKGIFGGGVVCTLASPTIANNTISGNTAVGYGGGISLDRGSSPVIAGNLITGNTASSLDGDGGGIACMDEGGGPSNAVIVGNVIRGNTAIQTGGGIAVYASSPVIANNVIEANQSYVVAEVSAGSGSAPRASQGGGGIYVSERYADDSVHEGLRANPTIINNVIAANGGPFWSGGLYVRKAEFSAPLIANNTIVSNNGAGLSFTDSGPRIVNNIVAFNLSGVYGGANPLGVTTPSLRANCVYGNGFPLLAPVNYLSWPDQTGLNGNISADPLLASVAYRNLHIQPNSPCRDAGDRSVAQADWTDCDGQTRIAGAGIDIGADESDGVARAVTPLIVRVDTAAGADANDGSAWNRAKRTVQAAANQAALAGGEVWVKAGSSVENVWLMPYAYLFGGFSGNETARAQRNWTANVSTLDGGAKGSVVTSVCGYLVSAVDGFTLRNGRGLDNGGGILCNVSSPSLAHNTITGNASARNGAGLYIWHGHPAITDSAITNNVPAFGGFGGGLYADWSNALVTGCEFAGNGNDGWGGGMEFHYSSPIIARNVVHGNKGIGIFCASSVVTVAGNSVYENQTGGPGAGSYFQFCTGRVTSNYIVSNVTTNMGGGMHVDGSDVANTPLTVANNTFVANSANYLGLERGGGISYYLLHAGNLAIANNVFAYNSSGIYQLYQDPPGPAASLFHNAYYSNQHPNLWGAWVDDPVIGLAAGATDRLNVDPRFVSLSPPDLRLQAASPLIDAGDDAYLTLADRDVYDRPRLLGAHADIGAAESGALSAFAASDLKRLLRAIGGLQTATLADAFRLNAANTGASFGRLDAADAIAIARKIAGLDANP